jgi:hypothetical protein
MTVPPILLICIGTIGLFTKNHISLGIFGYMLNIFSMAVAGVLVPFYVVKLSKEKDWSCTFLWSIFLISLVMTLLYLPIKFVLFFING